MNQSKKNTTRLPDTINTGFFKIKKLLNTHKLDKILEDIKSDVDTYNKIMNNTGIGLILINNLDTILIHHLIMYSDHINIKLVCLPSLKGRILGIKRDSVYFSRIERFLDEEGEYKLVDIYK